MGNRREPAGRVDTTWLKCSGTSARSFAVARAFNASNKRG
jgi:hypothetical protein